MVRNCFAVYLDIKKNKLIFTINFYDFLNDDQIVLYGRI